MNEQIMINACEEYIRRGFVLTPVCSFNHAFMSESHKNKCDCPGKAAILKGWKDTPMCDINMIRLWMQRFPDMNIGMVLGKRTGYIAVDIDLEAGEKKFYELSNGVDYRTWSFSSPGGGKRFVFKIPDKNRDKVYNRKSFDLEDGACTFMGQGQQMVLPPSVHCNGGSYEWIISMDEAPCMDAPDWISELMINSDDTDTTYDGLD